MVERKTEIYTFLSILLWSFIPVVSTLGGKSLGVEQFLLLSNLLSSLAILPFIDFKSYSFTLKSLAFSAVLSFLGIFGYYLLLYYAYSFSSNSIEVLIIQYLWPIFISIFSIFLLNEKLGFKKILALILGFSSAVLVISKGEMKIVDFSQFKSLSLAFLASISFALYSVLSKKRASKYPANDIFVYFFIATLLSLILFFARGEALYVKSEDLLYLLLNGLFINGISYLFWIWALKDDEASKLSVFTLSTPLVSIVWIYLFLGEPIRLIYLLALFLSIFSGFLASDKKQV